MPSLFNGRKILLCMTGGIAAYKVCDWIRLFKKEGAEVTVLMTRAAGRFIASHTPAALSGNRVYSEMFVEERAHEIPHINLARDHDLILIAPATANTMARLAHGLADDLLSAVVLASRSRVVVCPAMNSDMYLHPATQINMETLKDLGYEVVQPGEGTMACGEEGPGRLPEWEDILEIAARSVSSQDLAGKSVLITAGPTEEPLDPVRFLSNRSSGKMGYALARMAWRRGAEVNLVSGPTALSCPTGVKLTSVRTAGEMHDEVISRCGEVDFVIKAAAVSDLRPRNFSAVKIKKSGASDSLGLTANPDILAELGDLKKEGRIQAVLAGFAAESGNLVEEGKRKLTSKGLDLIVVNNILADDAGFASENNRVIIIDREKQVTELPLLSKEETANRIWDAIRSRCQQ
ncbi:MAG: bifunctional phosphopantothenoylcysteine decarboxylase/phosphopantothenate--cysteine ligase CoaBC [Desulfurivibrionaceae bacterium]